MHILVTGGAGYVGACLVPDLLLRGHKVTVLDLYLFGDDVLASVKGHPNLIEIKGDIRNKEVVQNALKGCDTVIHLACISNDPSFELDPVLGRSINLDAFEPLLELSKQEGVSRFIYASSSSVYGVKKESNVTEDMKLEPLTDYSKYKAECEEILIKHLDDNFTGVILRPATVCGYSPRQRLDVVVNILTNLGYNTGKVKIMGGKQLRPNIHIKDMVRAYCHVLDQPAEKVQGQIYNVGYENHSVESLGEIVRKLVSKEKEIHLVKEETDDNRSYHVSSEKIKKELGFTPKFTVEDAVEDLIRAFKKGDLPNSISGKEYSNIKTMNALDLK
ncbi:MAG: dTDP-glucose 4,6-dehydratase [Chlamydiae bacterium]|nr:dTDP-glucose 4,6-dehydratase [Chlamydiota bacterium]